MYARLMVFSTEHSTAQHNTQTADRKAVIQREQTSIQTLWHSISSENSDIVRGLFNFSGKKMLFSSDSSELGISNKTKSKCGHEVSINSLCKQIVKRQCPCGDFKVLSCFEEVGECDSKCKLPTSCGHRCRRNCHWGIPHSPCEERCGRTCASGRHDCPQIRRHLCSTPCPPCEHQENIICKKCGGSQMVFCSNNYAQEICSEPCQRMCKGGNHPCDKKCGEDCGQCNELVSKLHPKCGHTLKMACHEVVTMKTPCTAKLRPNFNPECRHPIWVNCGQQGLTGQQLLAMCKMPCGVNFYSEEGGCGHTCSGKCCECLQGRFHVRCEEKCGRTLFCGHVCKSPCASDCPPCEHKCERKCDHKMCDHICSLPCIDCQEKCSAKCVHSECTQKCHEICDRVPCEEECLELLPCGHGCVGFCGEVCPCLCRICNPKELEAGIFTGDELTSSQRFIQMDNCSHVVERESLDGHMTAQPDMIEIMQIGCPICKSATSLKRYSSIIKRNRDDIDDIKRKIRGHEEEGQMLLVELAEILVMLKEPPLFAKFHEHLLRKLLNRDSVPSAFELKHMKAQVEIWRNCEKLYGDLAPNFNFGMEVNLHRMCEGVLNFLAGREVPLRQNEVVDVNRELLRVSDYATLCRKTRLGQSTLKLQMLRSDNALLAIRRAEKCIVVPFRYTKDAEKKFLKFVEILDTHIDYELNIDEDERLQILHALNTSSMNGRWYKCKNGHTYIITECGGAMVESVCNECKAPIGGQNHRLVQDNAFSFGMNPDADFGFEYDHPRRVTFDETAPPPVRTTTSALQLDVPRFDGC